MAEKLTPEQERAVLDRGGKLLVSAAAGSGKTKVLVDRLMSYLTDPDEPANIDEFLIITYTKAAASELRAKIAAKLSEKIAERPEDRHLQRQFQRLYMTQISTVHSFCGELLRQYAYRLDLSADLRVADENECTQLRMEVMDQVLEEAYAGAAEDPDLCAFIDTQGIGRNDRKVPEIIEQVYDSARCHLEPEGWLQGCLDAVDVDGVDDVAVTRWGQALMEELRAGVALHIDSMDHCARLLDAAEEGEKYAALFSGIVKQLEALHDSQTWDQVVERKLIDYGTLRFSKKFTDLELQEGVKAVRDACKVGIPKLTKPFTDPSTQVLEDLTASACAVRGMISLVRAFGKAYSQAKERRRILDFGDLEHRTLDLLLGKNRSTPTAVAKEVGRRFREVMVDEYQDSNEVQDAIYSALTKERQNCFMVGDVKQSIYQFRLADPGIFLEKYARYVPAEGAEPGQGRKVLLSRNFRSGGAVLSAVNHVFRCCMSPDVGGLRYGPEESLYEGIPHDPLGEPEVELHAVQVRESAYDEEAAFVAQRIRQLLDGTHMVRGKDGLRPVVAEDIVILLRSPGSVGEKYRIALERSGIRCVSGSAGDLLRTQHIEVLRSVLQTIHNPQLDIPLLAALASPVFGYTADDLAYFRGEDRHGSVFDALRKSGREMDIRTVQILGRLRHASRVMGLSQLLETVFDVTKIDLLYGAMPDGDVRMGELQDLYQLAVTFEAGGKKDLGRFLEHLEAMEEKGLPRAEESGSGSVTIMSIHKSKGLEFPVVFLCGLSRGFNRESQHEQVLCHKELGVGISAADGDRRVRYPTVAKRAIAARIGADGLSEELRVLYVAMTRARDRLIMTYADKRLEKTLTEICARLRMGQRELLTREAGCPGDWILIAALHRLEAGELFALGGDTKDRSLDDHPWLIRVSDAPVEQVQQHEDAQLPTVPADLVEELRALLDTRYPYLAATVAPSKQTATQRKGRVKDQEAAENAPAPKVESRQWRMPSFAGKQVLGRERGNALHAGMQYIRYEACTDTDAVAKELDRLVAERFLTAEQRVLVEEQKIAELFQTPLGRKLRSGVEVIREFKFSILDDGTAFDPALVGEKILLQGVVDCALLEPDGITVIDFKTDRVTEENVGQAVERYRPQVEAYAHALERIYDLPVKARYLYFFQLGKFMDI